VKAASTYARVLEVIRKGSWRRTGRRNSHGRATYYDIGLTYETIWLHTRVESRLLDEIRSPADMLTAASATANLRRRGRRRMRRRGRRADLACRHPVELLPRPRLVH
jgi:hypothetical protein